VGGGAGSHAAALARAAPGLEATVLDLPAVEPVLRERHPELAFVAGDLTGAELRRGAGPIAVVAARAPGPPDPPGA
jgi:O-methyltransferase domain